MGDLQEAIDRLDLDRSTGEVAPDMVAVLQDRDASGPVDPSTDDLPGRGRLIVDGCRIDHHVGSRFDELEPADGCDVAYSLMLPTEVVGGDP